MTDQLDDEAATGAANSLELRESLEPEDRTLLILRVDRKLSWNEVARILAGEKEPSSADLKRSAGRLRKRFQSVKDQLRERAQSSGLLDEA